MMKKMILLILLIIVVLITGCIKTETKTDETQIKIANPASVNCQEKGGKLSIITSADGSQSGICTLIDGTQCEEWAYFRAECPITTTKDISSCTRDEDCVPMVECHPQTCISYKYESKYKKPEVCTMIFDTTAAYKKEDCICKRGVCFNKNKEIASDKTNDPQELLKNNCTVKEKSAQVCTEEYTPTCGWYNENVRCIKYPCAQDVANPCMACKSPNVDYWTKGPCPK